MQTANELITDSWSKVGVALANYRRQVGHRMDLQAAEKSLRAFRDLNLAQLTGNERKSFWINLYHVYTIYLILKLEIKHRVIDKPWIFFLPKITVGGYRFSLDDIEHGILRGNRRPIYSLFPQFWPWDKRIKFCCEADYRIHFVLYCGASSCPPLQLYNADSLDTSLDKAEYQFASQNFVVNTAQKTIQANPIFSWYRNDFNGIYLNDPAYHSYKVKITRYDWSLSL